MGCNILQKFLMQTIVQPAEQVVWRGQSAIHECARTERENECDARGKEYPPLVTSLFYALPTVRLANGFRELVALIRVT